MSATAHGIARASVAINSGPCVWVSNSDVDPDLLFGFTCQLASDNNHALIDLVKAVKRGEALDPAALPSSMWIDPRYAADDRRKLPHFFNAGGFPAVSDAFAEVLRRHDLGRTHIHPVDLFHSDRETRFPGGYNLLNVAEVHRHFSAEHSSRFRPKPNSTTSYIASIHYDPKDDDLSVAPGALTGPAVWLDDTLVAFPFFSDALARELRAAKLTSRLPLYRCLVVATN